MIRRQDIHRDLGLGYFGNGVTFMPKLKLTCDHIAPTTVLAAGPVAMKLIGMPG